MLVYNGFMAKTGPKPKTPVERFWPKVEKNGPVPESRPDLGPCWLWTAKMLWTGYGQFWASTQRGNTRIVYAHRFAYEDAVGPIPEGLFIDHLCRVRACVNPAHLEPVTHRENTLRSNAPAAVAIRRGTCPKGHPRTEENRVAGNGGSYKCKICLREAQAKRRAAGARVQHHVKDACKRGHTFDEGSYSTSADGTRRCLTCRRMLRRRAASAAR